METLTFTLSDPIDTILNKIEDLAELGELSSRPFSDTQLTDFSFIIVNRNRAFREDIRLWMRKTAAEQTFANFKTHFTRAHVELRATDATVDELGYHTANSMVQQIVQELRNIVIDENPSPTIIFEHPNPEPPHVPEPPALPTANAVIPATDPRVLQFQADLEAMRQQVNANRFQLMVLQDLQHSRDVNRRRHNYFRTCWILLHA